MTEPGFRVEGRQQTVPFLVRSTYSNYHYFPDKKCAVLVKPEAARGMRVAAARALPVETGGLLSGRALRDDDGSYVVISGFVEAPPNAGQAATFRINPHEVREMRADAARADPGADEVGWWHTHRGKSSYSQVDRNTQEMFERPDSVGLLVFASGPALATAYVGPDARDLGYVPVPSHARQSAQGGGQPPQGGGQPVPAQRADEPADWPGPAAPVGRGPTNGVLNIPGQPAWRRRLSRLNGPALLLIIVAAMSIALLIVLVAGLVNVSGEYNSLQQSMNGQLRQLASQNADNYDKLSSQMASTPATPTAPAASSVPSAGVTTPSLTWSCGPRPHQGYWYCAVTSSKGTGSWNVEWYVDGKLVGGGRSNVPISAGQKETVRVDLVSPGGKTYPGPTQTLTHG
jgi:proteasome lid subunit RPN8/RPN11